VVGTFSSLGRFVYRTYVLGYFVVGTFFSLGRIVFGCFVGVP
jgi:hypothetical protein